VNTEIGLSSAFWCLIEMAGWVLLSACTIIVVVFVSLVILGRVWPAWVDFLIVDLVCAGYFIVWFVIGLRLDILVVFISVAGGLVSSVMAWSDWDKRNKDKRTSRVAKRVIDLGHRPSERSE
jgi:hypothetical protein